jgi:hypothetical protein
VSLTIQAHELAHVRYTSQVWPNVKKGLDNLVRISGTASSIVGYAEDMRITALAGKLGVKTLPEFGNEFDKPVIDKWIESFVKAGVPKQRVDEAIKFILEQHTKVVKDLGIEDLQSSEGAERYIIYCSQHIDELLKYDSPQKESKESGELSKGEGETHIYYDVLPDLQNLMTEAVPIPISKERGIQEFQHVLDTANWTPVTSIDRMPLVRRAVQARRKGLKASETGVTLRNAYDAVSPNERRPFTQKRKGGLGGLTILIDCSGSMRISEKQMEQLLTQHPHGVVVTYSTDVETNTAIVRIIASHGRMAESKNFRSSVAVGNCCDGPMLEWLARQPGEKIWICDGAITQTKDALVPFSQDSMEFWLEAHHITRYHSMKSYLDR